MIDASPNTVIVRVPVVEHQPGLAIVILEFGFTLVGYALGGIVNPRVRRR